MISAEAVQAVVAGIVSGSGMFLLFGRTYLTKIDKNAKAIEELEPRVQRVEDQSKSDKSETSLQLEAISEALKLVTQTVSKLADDVAYLRGVSDGERKASKRAR